LPGTQRGCAQALCEHALGCIAQLVVLHVFSEHNNSIRLDDAFKKVDHAMDFTERLGFGDVKCMKGFEVSVHKTIKRIGVEYN
jgi:hypothetical protein